MVALKRRNPRSGRVHAVPGKHRRRAPADVVPDAVAADADNAPVALAPTFQIEAIERDPALEGAVDDWAGMDTVADMVDEPVEGHRRR